jgi:hypothetical protein
VDVIVDLSSTGDASMFQAAKQYVYECVDEMMDEVVHLLVLALVVPQEVIRAHAGERQEDPDPYEGAKSKVSYTSTVNPALLHHVVADHHAHRGGQRPRR